MVRIVPEGAVESLLSLPDSIDAIDRAHRELAAGRGATDFMETIDSTIEDPLVSAP